MIQAGRFVRCLPLGHIFWIQSSDLKMKTQSQIDIKSAEVVIGFGLVVIIPGIYLTIWITGNVLMDFQDPGHLLQISQAISDFRHYGKER